MRRVLNSYQKAKIALAALKNDKTFAEFEKNKHTKIYFFG